MACAPIFSNPHFIYSSGGVVINHSKNGVRVLLLHKNGEWLLPKGRQKNNESSVITVQREVSEETGLSHQSLCVRSEIGATFFIAHQPEDCYETRPKSVTYFLIETTQDTIHPLLREGFTNGVWFSFSEAIKKASYSAQKAVIWKAFKILTRGSNGRITDIVIPVGGKGARIASYFRSKGIRDSKVLFPIQDTSTLKYLLDTALNLDFKRIFLLANYYEKDIERFIRTHYYHNKKITLLLGGGSRRTGGVMGELYQLRERLKRPFIYSDGNIVYPPSLLADLATEGIHEKLLINVVGSENDLAPTHLQLLTINGLVCDAGARCAIPQFNVGRRKRGEVKKAEAKNARRWYSLGLMAVDSHIFDLLPELQHMVDIDMVVERLFRWRFDTDFDIVGMKTYHGPWAAFHKKEDIPIVKKFLSSRQR